MRLGGRERQECEAPHRGPICPMQDRGDRCQEGYAADPPGSRLRSLLAPLLLAVGLGAWAVPGPALAQPPLVECRRARRRDVRRPVADRRRGTGEEGEETGPDGSCAPASSTPIGAAEGAWEVAVGGRRGGAPADPLPARRLATALLADRATLPPRRPRLPDARRLTTPGSGSRRCATARTGSPSTTCASTAAVTRDRGGGPTTRASAPSASTSRRSSAPRARLHRGGGGGAARPPDPRHARQPRDLARHLLHFYDTTTLERTSHF